MTPADLGANPAQPVERCINIRRFQLEVGRLVEYINACQTPERCLVFFDGALVLTFAEAFDQDSQTAYVQAILPLLEAAIGDGCPWWAMSIPPMPATWLPCCISSTV
jgi:hypothetical protein